MKPKTPSRVPQVADKYIVRFPEGMREEITRLAKESGRSMNAEIVERLQASLNPIPDIETAMSTITALVEFGRKSGLDISVSISSSLERTLETAIKNGYLPADATVEDVKNPGPAIARLAADRASGKVAPQSADPFFDDPAKGTPAAGVKGGVKLTDPSPATPTRRMSLKRTKSE